MKKNLSIIALSLLFGSLSQSKVLDITFEDIDPKSFQDFTKPQPPPKVLSVPPKAVPAPQKVLSMPPKALPAPQKVVPATQKVSAVPSAPHESKTPKLPTEKPAAQASKAQAKTSTPTQSNENKTLVIGDSLSSSYGKFGPGVAEALSKNGNEACLYSVSGSRFDHWSGNSPMKNPVGSSETYFKDGKGGSKNYQRNDIAPTNWNLEKLLLSHSCGNPEKKFTHLVIQLGSNHDEGYSPVKDLDKIFALAKANGIQDIKFILPPDASKQKHQELSNKIKFYLSEKSTIKSSYFDTTKRVAISNKDLKDGLHFYNTQSEANWTSAVQNWIDDSNRFIAEDAIKSNSHNTTVSK
jgi:hypothetical protein